ncbi:MAG: acyl-CoA dehydrogenase [Mycobacterium sp.]
MGLAIVDEHRELEQVARRFLQSQGKSLAREVTEGAPNRIDGLWSGMVAQGWPGLHIPEEYGGQGFGYTELMVVLAEVGGLAAPSPLAVTAAVSGVLNLVGTEEQRRRHLPGLADGSRRAAVGLDGDVAMSSWPSSRVISGSVSVVIGATSAQLIAVIVDDDVVLLDAGLPQIKVLAVDGLDRTLDIGSATVDGAAVVDEIDVLRGAASVLRSLVRAVFAADALGIAKATTDAAVDYAKTREQFGQPIGAFQAVKHHCANMAVKTAVATASVWDVSRSAPDDADFEFVTTAAAASAFDAAIHNAELNIQIHGGMGFTWEHDAHIYLRRAITLAQLLGPLPTLRDLTFQLARQQGRRSYDVALPEEADQYRSEVRDFAARYAALPRREGRALAVETGYLVPHWPKPFGRAAGAVEQLVIDSELKGIKLPILGIGGWILQTLIQHGSAEQIDRWVGPTLLGEYGWCQLFSEPGAGSDAAAISTRAVKVDGGWSVTGQKIWTSGAESAALGLATIRTDAKGTKRQGITTVVVDMQAPGVTVRPLREMTGLSLFNEVFFDEVFVSDADVVGDVGEGWTVARATLGNERVTIGGGGYRGVTGDELIELLSTAPFAGDSGMQRRIGALLADEHAVHLMGLRRAVRALADAEDGNEGNITKLLSAELNQRTSELAMEFSGTAPVLGAAPRITHEYLFDRCLTIGGGTSEISRNVIAERILGLPRDPSAS